MRKARREPEKASRRMCPADEFVPRRRHLPSFEKLRLVQSRGCMAEGVFAMCGRESSSCRSKVANGGLSKLRRS